MNSGKVWANIVEGTFPKCTHLPMPFSRSVTSWVHLHHHLHIYYLEFGNILGCLSNFLSQMAGGKAKKKLGNETYFFPLNTRISLFIYIFEWFCFIYVTVWRTHWVPLLLCVLKRSDCILLIQAWLLIFLTMLNMKSHKAPCCRALEPYISRQVVGVRPKLCVPLFSHQTDTERRHVTGLNLHMMEVFKQALKNIMWF